jgi:hypothetical protein
MTLGGCFMTGILLFLISFFLSRNTELAEGIGALPILVSHHIAEHFEKSSENKISDVKYAQGLTFEKFLIPWYLMVIYATFSLWIMHGVAAFVMVIAGSMLVNDDHSNIQRVYAAAGIFIIIPACVAYFAIGRWIGLRGDKFAIYVLLAYPFLAELSFHGLDSFISTDDEIASELGMLGVKNKIGYLLFSTALGWLAAVLVGLIGFWRGRASRQTRYVSHLLKSLPKATRDVVASMLYDEVSRMPEAPHGTPA